MYLLYELNSHVREQQTLGKGYGIYNFSRILLVIEVLNPTGRQAGSCTAYLLTR